MKIRHRMRERITTTAAVALLLARLASAEDAPVDRHYQAAEAALASGETERGKRELRLSLQDNPLRSDSHFLLASLLAREGKIDQAIVGYRATVALETNNAAALYNLGTALLYRGEPVSAARLLEQAVLNRSEHVPSYINLAKAYYLAGLPELAVASNEAALRLAPSNTIALRNLALITSAVRGAISAGPGEAKPVFQIKPESATQPTASTPPPPPVAKAQPSPVPSSQSSAGPGEHLALEEAEVEALRELVCDLPHVRVERRGGQLTLAGWTTGAGQKKLLERIIAGRVGVLDLTGDDTGDSQRLIEVDATLFMVLGMDALSLGHNFLRRVDVKASVADGVLNGFEWFYSAMIDYEVNIANALEQRVAFLARPHLTTVSGTPASFLAGGDIVFKVAGTTSGDIKPYPFGTKLEVTPTLLRSHDEDAKPRVRLAVKAERKTILPLQSTESAAAQGSVVFDNVSVTSEAVLAIDQTLILTGLNQRERRMSRSGVPVLKSIPLLKHLFSTTFTSTTDLAIIILLTPRDPGFRDEQNRLQMERFTEKRRAYVEASRGTEEDMRRFKERYPDWYDFAPNRLASHFFLMENSDVYRRVSGMDLADESLDFDLLGPKIKKKKAN